MQTIGKHATTITTDSNGPTRVTYHNTDVVTFSVSGVCLDSGGWRTATTKKRMNQTSDQFDLGFCVYQSKGEWYVEANGETLLFTDGMYINTPEKGATI